MRRRGLLDPRLTGRIYSGDPRARTCDPEQFQEANGTVTQWTEEGGDAARPACSAPPPRDLRVPFTSRCTGAGPRPDPHGHPEGLPAGAELTEPRKPGNVDPVHTRGGPVREWRLP